MIDALFDVVPLPAAVFALFAVPPDRLLPALGVVIGAGVVNLDEGVPIADNPLLVGVGCPVPNPEPVPVVVPVPMAVSGVAVAVLVGVRVAVGVVVGVRVAVRVAVAVAVGVRVAVAVLVSVVFALLLVEEVVVPALAGLLNGAAVDEIRTARHAEVRT